MSAQIIELQQPDDEFEHITCIPLVDVDPEVVVRRCRQRSWEDRARFFDNILRDSLENASKMLDMIQDKDQGYRFLAWVQCACQSAVAEIVKGLGETTITCGAQAAVYNISIDFRHRWIASAWLNNNHHHFWHMGEWAPEYPSILVFRNMVMMQQPATVYAEDVVESLPFGVEFTLPGGEAFTFD